jgi:hypothetical protein
MINTNYKLRRGTSLDTELKKEGNHTKSFLSSSCNSSSGRDLLEAFEKVFEEFKFIQLGRKSVRITLIDNAKMEIHSWWILTGVARRIKNLSQLGSMVFREQRWVENPRARLLVSQA